MPDVQRTNNLAISNVPDQEWKPPTEPLDTKEWEPPTKPLAEKAKPEESPNIISRAWAAANEPLIKVSPEMRQALDAFKEDHPIMGGVGETALGAVTGLSSPMALGLSALSGGATLAPEMATALHIPGRMVGAGAAGHGLYNVFSQPTLGGKIGGGIEAGLGALGMRSPVHAPIAEPLETGGAASKIPLYDNPEVLPPEESVRTSSGRVTMSPYRRKISDVTKRALLEEPRTKMLNEGPRRLSNGAYELPASTGPGAEFEPVTTEGAPREQLRFKSPEDAYSAILRKQNGGIDVPKLPAGIHAEEGKFSEANLKRAMDERAAKKAQLPRKATVAAVEEPPAEKIDLESMIGGHGHPDSPEYVQKVLDSVGRGKSKGLSIQTIDGVQHLIYRGENGKAIAVAKIVQEPSGKKLVSDMAVDKSKGLLSGRAMKAIADQLDEMGATEPAGTISPDAQNFLDRMKEKKGFGSFVTSQEGAIKRPNPYDRTARPEAINKLVDALKAAGAKRATQEEMYSEERSARINAAQNVKGSGLGKLYGQLHELKGELPKVDFERTKLSPTDLNDLLNTVDKSSYLLPYEKIRAKMGLLKMLTAKREEVPTESELKLLGQVFGKDFDEVVEMHGGFGGPIAKQILQDVANAPKAIMASVDMSAPLRQGLPLIHKKEWWNSIKPMVQAFANESNYEATMQSIKDRPKYLLGKQAGLKLTGMDSDLGTREEAYGSNIANLVPGVKRSERAYVAFLNKLRADTFDSLIEDAKRQGLHPKDVMHEVANFVNVATGRGSLGNLDKVATELNTVFFSPRLIASRLTMLNPNYYVKASPFVRKEALKSLLATASAGLTVNGLMSAMGAKTDTTLSDSKGTPLLPIQGTHGFSGMPINADFGKSRFGNTRIENYGGFLPYITYAGRMLSGERESSTTGKITQLGKGFNTASRLSTTEDFVANKLSPVASLAYKILKQKDPTGKEYQLSPNMKQSLIDISNGDLNAAIKNAKSGEIGDMFIPMFVGDLISIYKDDPKHLPLAAGSFFGMGTQTYPPTQRKSSMFKLRP